MTDKAISPLRQRLIDDMAIRRLGPKTQHDYIRRVKSFADFVGHSPDKATAEDVHRYQMRLVSIGATVPTVNATASALRFFFGTGLPAGPGSSFPSECSHASSVACSWKG